MFRVGTSLLSALFAVLMFAADAPAAERQLLFKVQVCEGDPAGSFEAGTLKILAAPHLVTLEGTPAMLHVGGEVPLVENPQSSDDFAKIGTSVELKPGMIDGEQVRFHLKLSHGQRVGLPGATPAKVETRTLETVVVAKLGAKTKVSGFGQGKQQHWIEVTVEPVAPAN